MVERGKKTVCVKVVTLGFTKSMGVWSDYIVEINNFRYEFQPEKFTRAGDFFLSVWRCCRSASLMRLLPYRAKSLGFFLTDVIVTYVCESREGFPRSEKKSEKTGI